MDSYSLELKGFQKYLPLLLLLSSIIFFFFLIQIIQESSGLFTIFFAFGIISNVFYSIRLWKMPVKIRVSKDGIVTLIDNFKNEKAILMTDILNITINNSTLKIETPEFTVNGLSGFDDFSSFVEDVRKLNSQLITKGC